MDKYMICELNPINPIFVNCHLSIDLFVVTRGDDPAVSDWSWFITSRTNTPLLFKSSGKNIFSWPISNCPYDPTQKIQYHVYMWVNAKGNWKALPPPPFFSYIFNGDISFATLGILDCAPKGRNRSFFIRFSLCFTQSCLSKDFSKHHISSNFMDQTVWYVPLPPQVNQ